MGNKNETFSGETVGIREWLGGGGGWKIGRVLLKRSGGHQFWYFLLGKIDCQFIDQLLLLFCDLCQCFLS